MKILIVGCGRLGSLLAAQLDEDGHEVTVVEENVEQFSRLPPSFRGKTVVGNGIDRDVLREGGAEKAEMLIAVTDSDNANLMSALVGQRILHVPRVVAVVFDSSRIPIYERYGIETHSPTSWLASCIRESVKRGG